MPDRVQADHHVLRSSHNYTWLYYSFESKHNRDLSLAFTTMSIFDVPGWSVPATPVQEGSKKRKRPSHSQDVDKSRTANVDLEKLVAKIDEIEAAEARAKKKSKNSSLQNSTKGKDKSNGTRGDYKAGKGARDSKPSVEHEKTKENDKRGRKKEQKSGQPFEVDSAFHTAPTNSRKNIKRNQKDKKHVEQSEPPAMSTSASHSKQEKAKGQGESSELTALQAGMKNSLKGARFRYVFLVLVLYSLWKNLQCL
jgi:ribosomal RNA-processing protein 8